jgi:hypothetical protein
MTALPRVFEGLADVGAEHAEFELVDLAESDDNVKSWLGSLPTDGTRLIVFAQDGTGSLFCVWLRPGQTDVESAPIVYLGSEGELGVLGKDPAAFLEFVASGMTFDGHASRFFDPLDSDDDDEYATDERARRAGVVEFVRERTGKSSIRHPDLVRAEAEAAYPGFEAWVSANNTHILNAG